jgi:hypothetical protein
MHYIRSGDGSEELYDLMQDPEEEHDLSESAEQVSRLRELRVALDLVISELPSAQR